MTETMVSMAEFVKNNFLPILIVDKNDKPLCWTLDEQSDIQIEFLKNAGVESPKAIKNLPFTWFGDIVLMSAISSQIAQQIQQGAKGGKPQRIPQFLPGNRVIRDRDEDEEDSEPDADAEDEDEDTEDLDDVKEEDEDE